MQISKIKYELIKLNDKAEFLGSKDEPQMHLQFEWNISQTADLIFNHAEGP